MKESFYSWSEYSFLFKQKAQEKNIPENITLELLHYAQNLNDRKLPIIYDLKHLSYLTGYRLSYIIRATTRANNFYRHFKIPKKNGHTREISEPLPGLKSIQYWILENILKKNKPNFFNNAYNIGKSIKTNAKYHTKQQLVLNVDIENYFQNISTGKVNALFRELGYNDIIALALAKLCTLDNGLPQGAPVSPILSNLITKGLDIELFDYCRESNLRYSRYADDITISGTFSVGASIKQVKEILKAHDFSINIRKLKAKKHYQRQMVTGLVVNKKISIQKGELKKLRQEMYYIKKFGFVDHANKRQINKKHYMEHLFGKLNYFLFISPGNIELKEHLSYLKSIFQNIE